MTVCKLFQSHLKTTRRSMAVASLQAGDTVEKNPPTTTAADDIVPIVFFMIMMIFSNLQTGLLQAYYRNCKAYKVKIMIIIISHMIFLHFFVDIG